MLYASFLVFNISAFCYIQCEFSFFFFFFFIFALRFAFTLNYFTLLLLLHTHISSSGNCSCCIRSLFVSLLFVLYPVLYIKSSISQKENHLSLRKSVKWRFTLKFVFRQIQEDRLLVCVICIYVCNMYVCVRNERLCQFSKFTFRKEHRIGDRYLVRCNVPCKVIVSVHTLIVIVMRLE